MGEQKGVDKNPFSDIITQVVLLGGILRRCWEGSLSSPKGLGCWESCSPFWVTAAREGGGRRGALLTSWFFSFSCELTFLFLSQGALVQPADWLLPGSKAVTSVLPSPFRGEVCMDHSRISTRTRGDVVGGAGRRPRLGVTSQHTAGPDVRLFPQQSRGGAWSGHLLLPAPWSTVLWPSTYPTPIS